MVTGSLFAKLRHCLGDQDKGVQKTTKKPNDGTLEKKSTGMENNGDPFKIDNNARRAIVWGLLCLFGTLSGHVLVSLENQTLFVEKDTTNRRNGRTQRRRKTKTWCIGLQRQFWIVLSRRRRRQFHPSFIFRSGGGGVSRQSSDVINKPKTPVCWSDWSRLLIVLLVMDIIGKGGE